jgi:4-hydroxybenzoate polyprenyltransferase
LVLAALLGVWPFVMHGLAVAYSVLMYREFFIGRWLRPHLTLYAVVHTLVASLLGWSIAVTIAPQAPWTLAPPVLAFGLVNWMLFNVFEFARKTFAPVEERDRVDSYSKVFGPAGAGWLTVSQILVALAVLAWFRPSGVGRDLVSWLGAVAALPVGAAILYGIRRGVAAARTLRTVAGAWVVLFFAVVAAAMLGKGG